MARKPRHGLLEGILQGSAILIAILGRLGRWDQMLIDKENDESMNQLN